MFKRPFDLVERIQTRLPMGPRKKSKPNPEADTDNNTAKQESSKPTDSTGPSRSDAQSAIDVHVAPSLSAVGASQVSQSSPSLLGGPRANGSVTQRQVENRASWYGSWKGKAKPVAEVAKDNVPASPAQPSTPKAVSERRLSTTATSGPAPSPRRYMSGSIRQQSKAAALPASTSNLSAVSSNTKDKLAEQTPSVPAEPPKDPVVEPPLPPDPAPETKQDKDGQTPSKEQQRPVSGWFGWWSRPDGYEEKPATAEDKKSIEAVKDAQVKPLPESPAEERTQPTIDQYQLNPSPSGFITVDSVKKTPSVISGTAKSSWFWLWSSQQNDQSDRPLTANGAKSGPTEAIPPPTEQPSNVTAPNIEPLKIAPLEPMKVDKKDPKAEMPRKATSWAFWSREETASTDTESVHKQVGEIAVADTPSQTHPEAAQFNEASPQPAEEPAKGLLKVPKAKSLRGRGKDKETPSQSSTPAKNTPSGSPERKSNEPSAAAIAGKSVKDQPKQTKEHHKDDKNLLLPDFNNTYSLLQQPSLWAQLRRMFISDPDNFPGPHMHLISNPPRIKKALAIGVHGFFPSPIYQKILGQPTGTSIRFANCAAQAIKDWTSTRDYECEIEKVALEGEGFVADRVDTLWKLLLNWIEHIRQADFILVACHSQGVPVAIQLVAKLIAFGCVSNARIGVCAMAGVSLGPFAEYKTRIFGGSALELFDFADPKSKISETYRTAVEEVLKAGVRIVYVGSIDDQLVSLESSTFSPVSHPNIYRAVFIDGRLHTSDFLSQLIGFTLKLRNLGLPDHGLIRELSPALAGSLYTGEGHSSLHNYLPIYSLAVRHALETVQTSTSPGASTTEVKWIPFPGPPNVKDANPFFLPWAMRGILEEEAVRKNLGAEVEELLKKFEEWKPVSKGLKDIRFRLEAVRSKL